jgi:hypothetical protein
MVVEGRKVNFFFFGGSLCNRFCRAVPEFTEVSRNAYKLRNYNEFSTGHRGADSENFYDDEYLGVDSVLVRVPHTTGVSKLPLFCLFY